MYIGADGATLRSCRPAAVLPPSIKSLQLYARVAAVVVADFFIGACHLSPHHTPYFRCAATSCASPLHVHRLRYFGRLYGKNYDGNLRINTSLYSHRRRQGVFTYQVHYRGVVLWDGDFAHNTDGRDQTTCGQHNATCATCLTAAAAVGHVMYVRGASLRYAESSCFRLGDNF